MHIILSLGGSLISTEKGVDRAFILKIKEIIDRSRHKFAIVTGGGSKAREYAQTVRERGGNEFEADEAAIKATKENAKVVIEEFKDSAYEKVLENFSDARKAAKKKKVIVMGGTIPGITTDTDATLLAEAINAGRLVNISNVDGVYDANPKTTPQATKYEMLTYQELINLAAKGDSRRAGEHFIFDLLACKLIARSRIETHFVSGKNLDDVENAIEGKKHNGTIVK